MQSPNAASLGLYGEVPVSLYTGLPNIEVPLYSVQEGPIQIPIALSYHASGFRPDTHPGWVGLGWNLTNGGIISRTVHDLPDEYSNSNYFRAPNGPTAGFYFTGGGLNSPDWSDTTFMKHIAQTNLSWDYDTEPDEFTFNFGNYSGKFYLDPQHHWKVKCDKPLQVSEVVPNQPAIFLDVPFPVMGIYQKQYGRSQTFAGFTVTTEDGTQYVFGGTTAAIEYEISMFHEDYDEWRANSWHLTQIIHNDGHHVEFAYERDPDQFVVQLASSMYSNISTRAVAPNGPIAPAAYYFPFTAAAIAAFDFTRFGSNTCQTSSNNEIYDWQFSGQLIAPVYLASIQTSNVSVFFDRLATTEMPVPRRVFEHQYNTNPSGFIFFESFQPYYPASLDAKLKWKKLTAIRVVSKFSAQPIKSYSFTYNDNALERLTLLAVTEQGSNGPNGLTKPAYQFGYNKYHGLPGYFLNKVDHWGFYNNQVAIADYTNNYSAYYGYREASTDSAVYLAGMLTRIVYPTGGKTDFEYEQHSFSQQLAENRFLASGPEPTAGVQPAGGVRIKRITSTTPDKPEQKLTKEYFYVTGYTPTTTTTGLPSSGVLGGRARYVFLDYRAKAYTSSHVTYSRSIFSSQSVLPASSNSRGSHIGYSRVVEKRNDGSYTQYSYSNFDTGNLDEAPANVLQAKSHSRTLYSPYSSTEEERGKLLQEDLYNSSGTLVKQKRTDYVAFNKATEYVPALAAYHFEPCQTTSDPAGIPPTQAPELTDEATAYKFYTYSYLPIRQTETVYDKNGLNALATVKTFEYTDKRLVRTETVTDSKGGTLQTRYKYCFDFPYNGPQPYLPSTRGIALMSGPKNMVGLPIESLRLRNGKVTGATVALYSEFQSYQVLPGQVLELNPAQPLDLAQYATPYFSGAPSSNFQQFLPDPKMTAMLTFNAYDRSGNVSSLTKVGAQPTGFLWGYGNNLLVAKATNALSTEIFHSNFEERTGQWDSYLNYDGGMYRTAWVPGRIVHTGDVSGTMSTNNPQEQAHSFSSTLTISPRARKFVFSGWVYSEGPAAQLWLFLNRPAAQRADGTIDYYNGFNNQLFPIAISTNQTGRWVYLEKEVDVPADVTLLTLRLTNYFNSASAGKGAVWFDDVRLHPADAQMTTYTHTPGIGLTSMSDENNRPTYYEYDELNRLSLLRDQDRNVLKQYQYHYRRQ